MQRLYEKLNQACAETAFGLWQWLNATWIKGEPVRGISNFASNR